MQAGEGGRAAHCDAGPHLDCRCCCCLGILATIHQTAREHCSSGGRRCVDTDRGREAVRRREEEKSEALWLQLQLSDDRDNGQNRKP